MPDISKIFCIARQDGLLGLLKASKRFVRRKRINLYKKLIDRKTVIPLSAHFKYRTKWNQIINGFRYDAPPDPFSTININPNKVEFVAQNINRNKGLGRVKSGVWDTQQYLELIGEHKVIKGLKQRFAENKRWKETVYYTRYKKYFESRGTVDGYESLEEFIEVRCDYVDQLFMSICDEGYRPNFESHHNVPEQDTRNTRKKYVHELEPLVAIGRDGDIYWVEGFHRLAIAQVLELDSIPVNVAVRHSKWQKRRDEIQSIKRIHNDLRDHPDLRDMI